MLNINLLWHCQDERKWKNALKYYDDFLNQNQIPIETRMANLNSEEVRAYSSQEFYQFLYDKYFLWKYTAKNRLATTRKSLMKYEQNNMMAILTY